MDDKEKTLRKMDELIEKSHIRGGVVGHSEWELLEAIAIGIKYLVEKPW